MSDILFNTILEMKTLHHMHKVLHTSSITCKYAYIYMEYIISLCDNTNIKQALQKVQEPSCVLDPPRVLILKLFSSMNVSVTRINT